MKTKIVYALVSDENDFYYEQLLISVYSLRRHNSDAVVEVVADEDTVRAVLGSDREVHKYIDKVVVADVPKEFSKMQRSRWIKTRLRRLVEGDYLFVDTDTVICDSLAECDDFEHDLCAVREKNYFDCFSEEDHTAHGLASSIGKAEELVGASYFNSGVMYVKDNIVAHKLYDEWHAKWNGCRVSGMPKDQVPLGLANKALGGVIAHVADKWNCQIKQDGMRYNFDAKIIHYCYGMGDIVYPLSSDAVYKTIRQHDNLPPYVLDMINAPKKSLVSMESVALLNDLETFARLQMMCPDMFERMRTTADLYMQERKKGNEEWQKMLSIIVVKSGWVCENKSIESLSTEGMEVLEAMGFAEVPNALARAEGRYVKVVSDEDWMDEVLLKECVDRLKEESADLVICDYYMKGKNGEDKLVTMSSVDDKQNVKIPRGVAAPKTRFGWFPPDTIVYRTEMMKRMAEELLPGGFVTAQEWEFYPLFAVEDIAYYKVGFYHCGAGNGNERMSAEQVLGMLEQRIAAAERMLKYYVERDHVLISAGTQLMVWTRLKRLFFPLMNLLMSMSSNEKALVLMDRLSRCLEQDPKLMKETREAVFGSM